MIKECIENLERYIGKDKIVKQNEKLYFIDTGLTFLGTSTSLPVFVVEQSDRVFIFDGGATLADYDFSKEEIEKLRNDLKTVNVSITDDNILMIETNEYIAYWDYNYFVIAISYIQVQSKLKEK